MREHKTKCYVSAMAVILFLGMVSFQCFAYLSDNDTSTNQITIGANKSEIVEQYLPPDSLKEGTVFEKHVSVKNTGSVPCYTRIVVLPAVSGSYSFNIKSDTSLSGTQNWYHSGGEEDFYYYKKILAPGESTDNLFTTVRTETDMSGTDIRQEDCKIYVYEETQQSDGFSNVLDAFGIGGDGQ